MGNVKAKFTTRWLLPFIAVVAVICSVVAVADRIASADLDRLLSGDTDVSITKIEIQYQQRRVLCSDKTVTSYLSDMMRQSSSPANGNGASYYFTFHFSTGRQYSLCGVVDATQFSLSVPNARPYELGISTHDIVFRSPTPRRVNEIFHFLVLPWEEVGGLTLYSNENKLLRYEYVPSLHGGNPRGTRVEELSTKLLAATRAGYAGRRSRKRHWGKFGLLMGVTWKNFSSLNVTGNRNSPRHSLQESSYKPLADSISPDCKNNPSHSRKSHHYS